MTSLTESKVDTLRRLHAAGCTDQDIALVFGVSRAKIARVEIKLGLGAQPTKHEDDPYGRSLKLAAARHRV